MPSLDVSPDSTDARTDVSRRRVLKGAATLPAIGLLAGRASADTGTIHTCGDDRDGPRTYPRVITRGHFENRHTDPTLGDKHTTTDYETKGDFAGVYDGTEILVFAHGWSTPEEYAVDAFYTASEAFSANGYDHPIVGFSYDSDTPNWEATKTIAAKNGPKLGNYVTDALAKGVDVRLMGHSLGARVVLWALQWLADGGHTDAVTSAVLIGGAADDGSVAPDGRFHEAIETAAVALDNYHKRDDEVLQYLYDTYEQDQAIGRVGADGTPPDGYADRDVTDSVRDHCAYYKQDVGCVPEIVANF